MTDGTAFKSAGTTGKPKFSIYRASEWDSLCEGFGRGMAAGGLRPGERLANLFYAGDLYASFLFITHSLERCGYRWCISRWPDGWTPICCTIPSPISR